MSEEKQEQVEELELVRDCACGKDAEPVETQDAEPLTEEKVFVGPTGGENVDIKVLRGAVAWYDGEMLLEFSNSVERCENCPDKPVLGGKNLHNLGLLCDYHRGMGDFLSIIRNRLDEGFAGVTEQ